MHKGIKRQYTAAVMLYCYIQAQRGLLTKATGHTAFVDCEVVQAFFLRDHLSRFDNRIARRP